MASDEERVEGLEADLFSEHESIDERRDLLPLLIAEVQVYPGIWNKKSPAYKEAQKKKLEITGTTEYFDKIQNNR
jgi:hypothetical protein